MPSRPKSICRAPGCGTTIPAPGFCDTHKRAVQRRQDERRGTAHERGYDSKWVKARVYYLRKHPLCVNCQLNNRLTAANVVDHVEPHRLKEAMDSGDSHRIARARYLFWDADNNWASLCQTCHNTVAQACERSGQPKPWDRRNLASLRRLGAI